MLRPTLASFQLRVLSQLGACRSAPAPSLSAKLSSRAQRRDLLFSFFSESLCLCVKSLSSLLTVNCRLSTSLYPSCPKSSSQIVVGARFSASPPYLWTQTMKNKKPNALQIWKHLEDHLVPRLCLSVIDRAVYSHLLRHSRLEGKLRLRFSILWLAL